MGVRSDALRSFGDDFSWSLLDAAPDGVLIVSGAGEIVFVNDHAGGLLDYEPGDLLGRSVDDLPVPSTGRRGPRIVALSRDIAARLATEEEPREPGGVERGGTGARRGRRSGPHRP